VPLLSYSAQAFEGRAFEAYQLDQELGLDSNGNYQTNARGFGEKYLLGAGNRQHVLFPDGRFFFFQGPYVAGTPLIEGGPDATLELLAELDGSYWLDPAKLWNAAPPAPLTAGTTPPNPVSVAGNQLDFSTPSLFAGDIYVEVTITGPPTSNSEVFKVTVTNQAPAIAPLADQVFAANPGTLSLPLAADDPDAPFDTVSFLQPQVTVMAELAFQVDQDLGLDDPGSNFYFDFHGQQEKWLRSAVDQNWYCLLPSGHLHVLGNPSGGAGPSGSANPIGALVAVFDSSYYDDPLRLAKAPDPGSTPAVSAVTSGGQLELSIAAGFVGTFRVLVIASDGLAATSEDIFITILS
jgi:hypothetical protein